MDTNGKVDMHFANVTIEVNSAGHDIFQRVSTGIKAGDQSVNGKQIREAIAFLAIVSLDLQEQQESLRLSHSTASHITANTTPGAFSITCPDCPQTHKARLAASCLTSASKCLANRRRISRTTGSSRRNGEKDEETKTAKCRSETTPPGKPSSTTCDERNR
jgi:hypothetical protein